jgi:pimeloyl-ACP methyl ester carboxylesterase
VARAQLGEIEIEYEVLGPKHGEPLLLIGGLGSQLTSFDDELCDELTRRGYLVVRYDNRDSGLSTSLDQSGVPDLLGLLVGGATAPYLLDDMAGDAAALLTHIGFERVHVLGLSLGGMIGQLLALQHPLLVSSLVAALSGPAGKPAALPEPEVIDALLKPPATMFAERVDAAVELRRVLAANDRAFDAAMARRRAEAQISRSYSPTGTMRQAAAVLATPNRLAELHRLRMPVLFLHGERDPLIPVASAMAAARAVRGAHLVTHPDLGHDLPPAAALDLVERMQALHHRNFTVA